MCTYSVRTVRLPSVSTARSMRMHVRTHRELEKEIVTKENSGIISGKTSRNIRNSLEKDLPSSGWTRGLGRGLGQGPSLGRGRGLERRKGASVRRKNIRCTLKRGIMS